MTPDLKKLCEVAYLAGLNGAQPSLKHKEAAGPVVEAVVRAVLMALCDVSTETAERIDYEAAFHDPNQELGAGTIKGILEEVANVILSYPVKA